MNPSYAISMIEGTVMQEEVDGINQAFDNLNLSFLRFGDNRA
jgi:hypothetical protein